MRRRGRKTENQNDAEALARIRFRPCRVKDVTEVIGFWNEFGAAHSLKDAVSNEERLALTAIEASAAGATASAAAPVAPEKTAVIDALPTARVVAVPAALMLATRGAELVQLATPVRSAVLPSV